MELLQHALHDAMTISPWGLIVIVWAFVAAVWKHIRERRKAAASPQGSGGVLSEWKGILLDTGEAVLIIICLWIVRKAWDTTGGSKYLLEGVSMYGFFECGHLANVAYWLAKCLLRLLK